jgi:hypothetical protein
MSENTAQPKSDKKLSEQVGEMLTSLESTGKVTDKQERIKNELLPKVEVLETKLAEAEVVRAKLAEDIKKVEESVGKVLDKIQKDKLRQLKETVSAVVKNLQILINKCEKRLADHGVVVEVGKSNNSSEGNDSTLGLQKVKHPDDRESSVYLSPTKKKGAGQTPERDKNASLPEGAKPYESPEQIGDKFAKEIFGGSLEKEDFPAVVFIKREEDEVFRRAVAEGTGKDDSHVRLRAIEGNGLPKEWLSKKGVPIEWVHSFGSGYPVDTEKPLDIKVSIDILNNQLANLSPRHVGNMKELAHSLALELADDTAVKADSARKFLDRISDLFLQAEELQKDVRAGRQTEAQAVSALRGSTLFRTGYRDAKRLQLFKLAKAKAQEAITKDTYLPPGKVNLSNSYTSMPEDLSKSSHPKEATASAESVPGVTEGKVEIAKGTIESVSAELPKLIAGLGTSNLETVRDYVDAQAELFGSSKEKSKGKRRAEKNFGALLEAVSGLVDQVEKGLKNAANEKEVNKAKGEVNKKTESVDKKFVPLYRELQGVAGTLLETLKTDIAPEGEAVAFETSQPATPEPAPAAGPAGWAAEAAALVAKNAAEDSARADEVAKTLATAEADRAKRTEEQVQSVLPDDFGLIDGGPQRLHEADRDIALARESGTFGSQDVGSTIYIDSDRLSQEKGTGVVGVQIEKVLHREIKAKNPRRRNKYDRLKDVVEDQIGTHVQLRGVSDQTPLNEIVIAGLSGHDLQQWKKNRILPVEWVQKTLPSRGEGDELVADLLAKEAQEDKKAGEAKKPKEKARGEKFSFGDLQEGEVYMMTVGGIGRNMMVKVVDTDGARVNVEYLTQDYEGKEAGHAKSGWVSEQEIKDGTVVFSEATKVKTEFEPNEVVYFRSGYTGDENEPVYIPVRVVEALDGDRYKVTRADSNAPFLPVSTPDLGNVKDQNNGDYIVPKYYLDASVDESVLSEESRVWVGFHKARKAKAESRAKRSPARADTTISPARGDTVVEAEPGAYAVGQEVNLNSLFYTGAPKSKNVKVRVVEILDSGKRYKVEAVESGDPDNPNLLPRELRGINIEIDKAQKAGDTENEDLANQVLRDWKRDQIVPAVFLNTGEAIAQSVASLELAPQPTPGPAGETTEIAPEARAAFYAFFDENWGEDNIVREPEQFRGNDVYSFKSEEGGAIEYFTPGQLGQSFGREEWELDKDLDDLNFSAQNVQALFLDWWNDEMKPKIESGELLVETRGGQPRSDTAVDTAIPADRAATLPGNVATPPDRSATIVDATIPVDRSATSVNTPVPADRAGTIVEPIVPLDRAGTATDVLPEPSPESLESDGSGAEESAEETQVTPEQEPVSVSPELLLELIGASNLKRTMAMFAQGKEIGEIQTATATLLDGNLDPAKRAALEPQLLAAGFANFEAFREAWKGDLHKQAVAITAEHVKWQVTQAIEADEAFQQEQMKGSKKAQFLRGLAHSIPAIAVGGSYGIALSGGVALLGVATLPAFATVGVAAAAGKLTHALWKKVRNKMEKKKAKALREDNAEEFEAMRKVAEEKVRAGLLAKASTEGHMQLASTISVLMSQKGPMVGEAQEIHGLRLQSEVAHEMARMAEQKAEGNPEAKDYSRSKRVQEFMAILRLRNAEAKITHGDVPEVLKKQAYWTEAMEEIKKSGNLEAWQESDSWKRQLAGYFFTGVTGGAAGVAIGYAGAGGILAKAATRFGIGAVGGGVSRFARERLSAEENPTEKLNEYIASLERHDPEEAKMLRIELEKILPKKLSTNEQVITALKSAVVTGGTAAVLGGALDFIRSTDTFKEVAANVMGSKELTVEDYKAGAKDISLTGKDLPEEVYASGKSVEAAAEATAKAEAAATAAATAKTAGIKVTPEMAHLTPEKLGPALEAKLGYNPIVGKGEGISTGPMMRDIEAHPERLQAYKEIKGIQRILDRHTDGSKLSTAEVKRAAGLIYHNDFGKQDLRIEDAGKVVVAFDQSANRYRVGTLDATKVEDQMYTRGKVAVPTEKELQAREGDATIKGDSFGEPKKGIVHPVNEGRKPNLTSIEVKVNDAVTKVLHLKGTLADTKIQFFVDPSENVSKNSLATESTRGGQRAYNVNGKFIGLYLGENVEGIPIFKTDLPESGAFADLEVTGPLDQPEVVVENTVAGAVEEATPKVVGKKIDFTGELPTEAKWNPGALQNLAGGGSGVASVETPTVVPGEGVVGVSPVVETVGGLETTTTLGGQSETSTTVDIGRTQELEPSAQSEVGSDTVTEQVRNRYDSVYIDIATKWVDTLRGTNLAFDTVDLGRGKQIGAGTHEFVHKIDTLLAKLSVGRPIDTGNAYLMQLLSDTSRTQAEILPVLKAEVLSHLDPNIRTQAQILLADLESGKVFAEGHACKYFDSTKNQTVFIYDLNYNFAVEGGPTNNSISVYDGEGNLVKEINPGGEKLETSSSTTSADSAESQAPPVETDAKILPETKIQVEQVGQALFDKVTKRIEGITSVLPENDIGAKNRITELQASIAAKFARLMGLDPSLYTDKLSTFAPKDGTAPNIRSIAGIVNEVYLNMLSANERIYLTPIDSPVYTEEGATSFKIKGSGGRDLFYAADPTKGITFRQAGNEIMAMKGGTEVKVEISVADGRIVIPKF